MIHTRCLRILLAVAFVATLSLAAHGADRSPDLWSGLSAGPHRVGFRTLGGGGLSVHAWYPTEDDSLRLRFRDYLPDSGSAFASFLGQAGVASSTIDSLLASPLFAIASARRLERGLPLVLVAQGNGQDAIDQAILCEYLASRGFVVATTPSPTIRTPLESEDQVGAMAERQASELAAAVDLVASSIPVNQERLAVVGHSFGARSALLLAMRDRRVRAVVSLDGGIGTATAVAPFRTAASFNAEAQLPPLLHFYEELDAFMTPDFAFLKSLHWTELRLEKAEGMHHTHFTTYGFAATRFAALSRVTHATASTGESVVRVQEEVADFLARHLN